MYIVVSVLLFYVFSSCLSLYLHLGTLRPDDCNDKIEWIAATATAFIAGPFILVTSLVGTLIEMTLRLFEN